MTRQEFEQIYVNYKEKDYPLETVHSVQRCYVPYEGRQQALAQAGKLVKISKKEAIADVKDFFNCLKRCYSGYDYFFSDTKCDDIQRQIIRKIKLCLCIKMTNRYLRDLIYTYIKDIINDSHFELYVYDQERRFAQRYIAYVCDIVLKKDEDDYIVVKGNGIVNVGYWFREHEVKEYLMPTLYTGENANKNDKYYLIGVYSKEELREVMIDGKLFPLHRILCDQSSQKNSDTSAITTHSSYGMPWNEELMQEFYIEGLECSKKETVVLNLLGNGGGSSAYPEHFYNGLAGIKDNGFECATLPMPEDIVDGTKKYIIEADDKKLNDKSKEYNGTLIIVMNKAVASSAEMAVSPAFMINNSMLVGSGTLGCSTYGECLSFQLANSKIWFSYGHKLFYHEKFEEGRGFLPDYWIDDIDPVSVVEKYLQL